MARDAGTGKQSLQVVIRVGSLSSVKPYAVDWAQSFQLTK